MFLAFSIDGIEGEEMPLSSRTGSAITMPLNWSLKQKILTSLDSPQKIFQESYQVGVPHPPGQLLECSPP